MRETNRVFARFSKRPALHLLDRVNTPLREMHETWQDCVLVAVASRSSGIAKGDPGGGALSAPPGPLAAF